MSHLSDYVHILLDKYKNEKTYAIRHLIPRFSALQLQYATSGTSKALLALFDKVSFLDADKSDNAVIGRDAAILATIYDYRFQAETNTTMSRLFAGFKHKTFDEKEKPYQNLMTEVSSLIKGKLLSIQTTKQNARTHSVSSLSNSTPEADFFNKLKQLCKSSGKLSYHDVLEKVFSVVLMVQASIDKQENIVAQSQPEKNISVNQLKKPSLKASLSKAAHTIIPATKSPAEKRLAQLEAFRHDSCQLVYTYLCSITDISTEDKASANKRLEGKNSPDANMCLTELNNRLVHLTNQPKKIVELVIKCSRVFTCAHGIEVPTHTNEEKASSSNKATPS